MFDLHEIYEQILFECFGFGTKLKSASLIAAGNQNQGIQLDSSEGLFFLKINFDHERDILSKEAFGLKLMRSSTFLKIPETYGSGRIGDYNYLLSEFIQTGRSQLDYWENLGIGLAHLHLSDSEYFGLEEDNYIASIPQRNHPNTNWSDFFIQERLEPLVGKAYFEQLIPLDFLKKFQEIYPKIAAVFPNEKPALIHGDLWSGNVLVTSEGQPCLIDPAVYYGHREMDLAFSKLFGGFESLFYDAYESVFPLEEGFDQRIGIYNLYPLLVHLNLFGASYLPSIERTIHKLLRS